jgi:hypothetical protein
VIAFLARKGIGPTAIHNDMMTVYGGACLKLTQIKLWTKRFREGRRSMSDDKRSGRPSKLASLAHKCAWRSSKTRISVCTRSKRTLVSRTAQ